MECGVAVWLKPRILFVVLLVLSVSTKLVLGASEYGDDWGASIAERKVVSFLQSYEFHLNEPEMDAGLWAVAAVKDTCHLRVAVVSPLGWHRQAVRHAASPSSRVFFVVDGQRYQDQPTWRTRGYAVWRRMNAFVGRRLAASLVLGVTASPECGWLDNAWSVLRAY